MVIKNKKKGQSFSTDVLVVVIIVLFASLFLVINKITEEESEDLDLKAQEASAESKLIVEKLKQENVIDSENNVDIELLLTLDEEQIRNELNIKNEFAIVFEKDGRLVKIDPGNNVNCVGSSNIVVNGEACK